MKVTVNSPELGKLDWDLQHWLTEQIADGERDDGTEIVSLAIFASTEVFCAALLSTIARPGGMAKFRTAMYALEAVYKDKAGARH